MNNKWLITDTKVKFKVAGLEGTGLIKGKASIFLPAMGAFYIVEVIESNIDKTDYDYPCVSLPETCMEIV